MTRTKSGTNRGATTLKRRRRAENNMDEFDRLPPDLRRWLMSAVLPWRPKSVRRAFDNAYRQTGDPDTALRALDQLQDRLIAKDAARIWGPDYAAGSRDKG